MRYFSQSFTLLATTFTSLAAASADDGGALQAVTVEAAAVSTPLNLDATSSSASRLGLSNREMPASVELLDQATIQERGARSFSEALRGMAGLSGGGPPSAPTTLSMRGFTNILYLYDGMRNSGAAITNRVQDTWNYERIEVLRGPASVIDGEGAIGGVVNFVTKRPDRNNPNQEAMLAIGSYGSSRAGFGAGGALGETGAYRIDFSRNQTRAGNVPRNGEQVDHLTTGFSADLGASVRLDLSFDYLKDNNQAYWGTPLVPRWFSSEPTSLVSTPDGRVLDRRIARINYNVPDDENASETYSARMRLSGKLAGGWSWRNELAGNKAKRIFLNSESAVFSAPGFIERDQTLITHDQHHWSNRTDATHEGQIGGMKNRFVVGFEHGETSFGSERRFSDGKSATAALLRVPALFPLLQPFNPSPALTTGGGNRVDTLTRVSATSLFVEDALKFTPDWTLVAGARHDRTRVGREIADLNLNTVSAFSSTYRKTSARLGLVYAIDPDTSVYAQYSNAALPVSSLFLLSATNASYPLATGRQLEAGIKQSVPRWKFDWTASLYKIELDNVLSRDPSNPNLTVNNGRQSSRGVELSAAWRPMPTLTLAGNLALVDARFDSLVEGGGVSRVGNRPPNVPARVANLFVTYRPEGSALEWYAGLNHTGAFFTDNANQIRVRGATTLDAAVSYRMKPVTWTFRIRNLTDRLYATWAGRATSQVLVAPGRTFEVAAAVAF